MIAHFACRARGFRHRLTATVVLTSVIAFAAAGCSGRTDQLASVVAMPEVSRSAPDGAGATGTPAGAPLTPGAGAFTPAFPGQPSPTPAGATLGGTGAVQPSGTCPPSGLVLAIAGREAAMGLRVVTLRAYNCSSAAVSLGGYPGVRLLDEDGAALPAKVLDGAIAQGIGDPKPVKFTLKPGQSADALLNWRNLTEIGPDPVTAAYVRVVPAKGLSSQILAETVDIGTTGRVAVAAWHRAKT